MRATAGVRRAVARVIVTESLVWACATRRGSTIVNVAPWSLAVAVGAYRAAVQFDEMAHDGHPEPEPAVPAIGGSVGLREAIEDERQELGAMPTPVS